MSRLDAIQGSPTISDFNNIVTSTIHGTYLGHDPGKPSFPGLDFFLWSTDHDPTNNNLTQRLFGVLIMIQPTLYNMSIQLCKQPFSR